MFENVAKDTAMAMYASMVRGIVLYHAHHLKLLTTYGAIANSTKTLPRGGQLAQAITLITEDDHKHGRPLSAAVIVNANTKRPGSGFFTQCRQLGYEIGGTEEEEVDFWFEQLFKQGVQPICLDGVEVDSDKYPACNMGTIKEVAAAARFSPSRLMDRWSQVQQKFRSKASEVSESQTTGCSQLPTG